MSRTKPSEAEGRELEFACDYCGAAVGEWCVTGSWQRGLTRLHSDRFYAAHAAGRLPLAPVSALGEQE